MLKPLVRTPARTILPVLLLVGAVPVHAQEQPTQEQQREHVVRRGDTLWDLARAYLQNPFSWRLIYEANRDVVENPHWIYPAERLIIPPVLPEVVADAAPRDLPPPLGTPLSDLPTEQRVEPAVTEEPTRVTTLDLRRPIVPLAEYLAAPWLSTTAEREVRGRVLGLADPAVSADRLPSNLHPNDRIHIGGLTGVQPQRGDSMIIVRFGRAVGSYGRVVEPLAVLYVEGSDASVATARVARQFGTARIGDPVLMLQATPEIGLGEPEPVPSGPEGQLVQFLTPEPLHGPTDVGFISLGSASGVGIGDEFAVYVPERGTTSQLANRLPPEPVGTVRVVKVGDRTATVRVLSVNSAALQAGLPVRMTRRMP